MLICKPDRQSAACKKCTPLIHLNDKCTGSVDLSDRGWLHDPSMTSWVSRNDALIQVKLGHINLLISFWGVYVCNQDKQAHSDHGNNIMWYRPTNSVLQLSVVVLGLVLVGLNSFSQAWFSPRPYCNENGTREQSTITLIKTECWWIVS